MGCLEDEDKSVDGKTKREKRLNTAKERTRYGELEADPSPCTLGSSCNDEGSSPKLRQECIEIEGKQASRRMAAWMK